MIYVIARSAPALCDEAIPYIVGDCFGQEPVRPRNDMVLTSIHRKIRHAAIVGKDKRGAEDRDPDKLHQ